MIIGSSTPNQKEIVMLHHPKTFTLRGRRLWPVFILITALLSPGYSMAQGTWIPVTNQAPNSIDTCLLLPDGTVMAASSGQSGVSNLWYRLTPDSSGSYANGTWSQLASMNDVRLYYSSEVLTNGEVFVAGGEYAPAAFSGTGSTNGEIYNPVLNTWTVLPNTPGYNGFYDSCSETLPNGNVLVAPVSPSTYGGTLIWNTTSSTWSTGPQLYRGGDQDEASWVKLPDNSILTIDPFGTNSERYIPSLNQWVNDANVPVAMYDPTDGEIGAAILLPNGNAIFTGGTGNSALYTPSGTASPGTWTAGPVLPNSQVTGDAPAAMEVNGKVLYLTSTNVYGTPTCFYEYDPTANSFTQINGPAGPNFYQVTYAMRLLDLPDGTILYSDSGPQLYIYQPGGSPLAQGQPTIKSITPVNNGMYQLTGTLLNGITEGAGYGDDAQMNSNYPLVRMTNSVGQVFYARTLNWNSTGVMTGTNIVSTDFVVPSNVPHGIYSLVVSANGNASAPTNFIYSPDSLLIANTNSLLFTGTNGGPFTPASISLTLTNVGSSSLNWSLGNPSTWLNVSSSGGTLTPGGPAVTISVSLTSATTNLAFNTYTATLLITNLGDQFVQSEVFTLQVNPPQLVQNGGFETGDFTDWTLDGYGYNYNFVDNGTSWYIEPHSGNYFALMGGQNGDLAYLSQTIPTTNGQMYLFSSWVNSPDGETPNEYNISWNGNILFDEVDMPALGWTNMQYFVTATGNSTVIQFGFRDDPSYLGLDDVSVTPVTVPALQAPVESNGSVTLTWNGLSELSYQLQYTTNLANGAWNNLGSLISPTGGTTSATDIAPTDQQRFYRLIMLP
jgi:hypothetical protein